MLKPVRQDCRSRWQRFITPLNQFTRANLLREVACEGNKSYFDTNTSNHYHFYLEGEGDLIDIPVDSIDVTGLPDIPEGKKISRIDVIVQLASDTGQTQ